MGNELKSQVALPVIVAPMFIVSSPSLVIESCRSGIIGSFPVLNARTAEKLEEWFMEIKKALAVPQDEKVAPWAVNFIVHKSNKRFEEDLKLIEKYEPPIVITSLGHPGRIVEVVQRYGGLVFSDVSTVRHAEKAAETGVDGLILVCSGAGGHAGVINPFAFLGAVRSFWKGTTIVAGAISSGRDVLAVQAMGADFAYMGTRFIATEESFAPDNYKEMLVDSTLDDLIYTDAFSGVHANYLVPSMVKEGIDPAKLVSKKTVDLSQMTDAKAWRDIWSAGQGVNTVDAIQSVRSLIGELKEEYEDALEKLSTVKGQQGINY